MKGSKRWFAKLPSLPAIKQGLISHYSAPLAFSFKRFRNGLIYFSVGFMIIFFAQTNLPPSLKQELITLFGLVMVAVGFMIAMLAQIRMIISRIVLFFTKK